MASRPYLTNALINANWPWRQLFTEGVKTTSTDLGLMNVPSR